MAAAIAGPLRAAELPLGLPEQPAAAAGFSPERLRRADDFLRGEIDASRYAGAVWLVAREGRVAAHGAVGFRNAARRDPMTMDTAFRIFSMTKIVTSVVVLSLLEEGRLNLDDSVARHLPALAKTAVLTGGTADAPNLVPAKRPVTVRHLLTHTSGYGYDVLGREPVLREIYTRANLWRSAAMPEFVAKVATLPLAHQPGESWTYGINTDILGAVVEAVTGRPFATVVDERVLRPLKMTSTWFHPPEAMRGRIADVHRRKPEGGLRTEVPFGIDYAEVAPGFASGGGGLISTAADYARFAQMLLNGGELDGVRILGRKTVELMTRNQIGHLTPRPSGVPGGFGLGVYVMQEGGDTARSLYSPGEFGWSGVASTFVSIDPRERVVTLLLLQHFPTNEDGVWERFSNTVYQALER
jgi:CubicO group peptidase (beta-lactamase class C family)